MSNSYISVARVRVIFVFIALTLFSQPFFVETKTESLLIFGDSISAGYGMSKDKQWSEELKKILDKEGIKLEVLNRSISGETTGGGLSRIKKTLDILRPDYLLIELGGNDALRGYPPKKIHENLKEMILISKGFNVEVFLMQIRILPNYGKRYQTQFESIYKKVSNETNTTLIPFMLQDVALDKNLMLQDGIHPNEKAQPLIANFVYKSLKTYLE